MKKKKPAPLYARIRHILDLARSNVARSVNTSQVIANWLIGREIVEEEQKGKARADYGARLIRGLAERLTRDIGRGFTVRNLESFRVFFQLYPDLINAHAVSAQLESGGQKAIAHAVRAQSGKAVPALSGGDLSVRGGDLGVQQVSEAIRRESWKPGALHPNLSWTHYRTLLRVEKNDARSFYEIEAIKENWSARELERQINSLLFERLAMSKDKKGLLKLAKKGHEVQTPLDVFKDPVVIEFLGLPESPQLVESDLEQALIDNLQAFLLELGKGFAFVSRQERITLDGDHFYIDLVFYHTILKCFVLIDLKVGKLTHQDLGQLQLYVNYYDRERLSAGDNPTLGLILCTDKNDAVVKYTLGENQKKAIFASRYKLYVPTEAELKAELRRELKMLKAKEGQQ